LLVIAFGSLVMAYANGMRFLGLQNYGTERNILKKITPQAGGYMALTDRHFWNLIAIDEGIKVTNMFHPWHFGDVPNVPANVLVSYTPFAPGRMPFIQQVDGLYVAYTYENHYASVNIGGRLVICPWEAYGGTIRVECDLPQPGILRVLEHHWPGWRARLNGRSVELAPGPWLSTYLPAGKHRLEFTYFSWDIPLGGAIGLAALAFLGWWWQRS
jgi:hypothetical protein